MAGSHIITLGFYPTWEVTCRNDGVDWGQHVSVSQTTVPADKALNVSKALVWLGQKTIAAGLWGQDDRAAAAAPTGPWCSDETAELSDRLEKAVAVATARAWGLTEATEWPIAKQLFDLETFF